MYRWDIINHLIKKNNYSRYLEIGYYKGWSFDQVKCANKWAVDPNPCKAPWQEALAYGTTGLLNKMTSDEYFAKQHPDSQYDIIFIDGLHDSKQVMKDIINSINHLSENGTIVLHDCNPPFYEHTTVGVDGCWTGDVYKTWIQWVRNDKYKGYTVDTDWGVGVLRRKEPDSSLTLDTHYDAEYISRWDVFDKNRKDLLNLISPEEFLSL